MMTPIVRKNFVVLQDLTPATALPAIHQDPFDRLLVAQALHEPMHLMTHNNQLVVYGDIVMWV